MERYRVYLFSMIYTAMALLGCKDDFQVRKGVEKSKKTPVESDNIELQSNDRSTDESLGTGTFTDNGNRPAVMTPFADRGTIVVFAHQDDDLLWMFPFWRTASQFILAAMPSTDFHDIIVQQHPTFYQQNWVPVFGRLTVPEYVRTWKTNLIGRQSLVSVARIKQRIEQYIRSPKTKRIVTHNNWGEYGHIQHRMVNQAVRELAVKYNKDVWALASQVSLVDDSYQDLGNLGLENLTLDFDHKSFLDARQLYLDKDSQTGDQLITWTWNSTPNSYPLGARTFIQLVKQGKDLSQQNTGVQKVMEAVSSYGGPYDQGSLFAVMVSRSSSCKGPIPAGDTYGGALNLPATCDGSLQPSCLAGFRNVKSGHIPDGDGEYQVSYCEAIDNTTTQIRERGKLYGAARIHIRNSEVIGCSGPDGGAVNSPFTCGADFLPQCRPGFRRVVTGESAISSNESFRYAACESTSNLAIKSPRRGGLYGYAVVTIPNNSGQVSACSGPNATPTQFPISCVSQNAPPECAVGYRRSLLGTQVNGETTFKFFTCESM